MALDRGNRHEPAGRTWSERDRLQVSGHYKKKAADWVVDGQDYYIEIADNVQLSVASTCQLSGSAGSVVTWRSDLIGWFDALAHALRFGSF